MNREQRTEVREQRMCTHRTIRNLPPVDEA
jgi:hypothetical protein